MNTSKLIAVIMLLAVGFASTAQAFSIGSRGGDVTDLQITLIEAGYDIPALTKGGAAYGYYGVQTDRANRLYQASRAVQSPVLGGVSSPDIQSPYFSFGGVRQWAASKEFSTSTLGSSFATTTPCALQSPVSTSTLQFASIQYLLSSTTASLTTIGKATTAFATTTVLSKGTAIANATLTLSAASTTIATAATQALGITDRIFEPSTWIVFGMQDTTPDGSTNPFSPSGQCLAVWVQN